MAAERILESMAVNLIGDGSSYQTMLSTAIRSTNQFADTVAAKFVQIGSAMQMTFGRMGSFGKEIGRMGMSFALEMSRIEGLVGASQKQMQEYEATVLGIAPKVGKAPKELASALYYITSAGFEGAQALDILEKSAMASAAGLGQTQTVADLITTAMTAYGKENLSAAKATDVLTAAVREGKAEATSFADAMGRVIPLAAVMGVQFGEVAAAIAVMSKGGLDAFEATTALRGLLSSLQHPSEGARESLRMFGLSAAELRDQIAQPNGLMNVLRLMKDRFGDASDIMSAVIPNVRAVTGVFNLLGQNAQDVDRSIKAITDAAGDMKIAFDVVSRQAAQQLAMANATVDVQLIKLGKAIAESVVPWFMQWNELLAGSIRWLNDFSSGTKALVAVMGALAAAAGPVLITFGLLFPLLASGFNAVMVLVGGIQKLAAVLVAAQLSGGWLFIGTVVAAAGYGLVTLANNIRGVTEEIHAHQAAIAQYRGDTKKGIAGVEEETAAALKNITEEKAPTRQFEMIAKEAASVREELQKAEKNKSALQERLKGVHGGVFGQFMASIGLPSAASEREEEGIKAQMERLDAYIGALSKFAKDLKAKQDDITRIQKEASERKKDIFASDVKRMEFELDEFIKYLDMTEDEKKLAKLMSQGLNDPFQLGGLRRRIEIKQSAEARKEVDALTTSLIDQINTFNMSAGAIADYNNNLKNVPKATADANRLATLTLEAKKTERQFESPTEALARRMAELNEQYLEGGLSADAYAKAVYNARKNVEGLSNAVNAMDFRSAEFWSLFLEQTNARGTNVELPKRVRNRQGAGAPAAEGPTGPFPGPGDIGAFGADAYEFAPPAPRGGDANRDVLLAILDQLKKGGAANRLPGTGVITLDI